MLLSRLGCLAVLRFPQKGKATIKPVAQKGRMNPLLMSGVVAGRTQAENSYNYNTISLLLT